MAAQTPHRLQFPRAARIKQRRDFARARQAGERWVAGCLIANWQRLPTGSASRLGVVTAGKIGGAVQRSRARRLLRETFRLHQHDLAAPVDLVLVARPSIVGKGFAAVERDFLATLRKARLLKPAEGEGEHSRVLGTVGKDASPKGPLPPQHGRLDGASLPGNGECADGGVR